MTVREKNHIYHEESLKHSIRKTGQKPIFHLMSELPVNEPATSVCWCINTGLYVGLFSDWTLILYFVFLNQDSSKRNVVSFENDYLDFEVDLTDLETFGETTPTKKSKTQELHNSTKPTTQPAVSETVGTKTKQINPKTDPVPEQASSVDSDDEKLVIDDSLSHTLTPNKQPLPRADIPLTPESGPAPEKPESSSSPQKLTRQGRQSRKLRESGDQLSEILRMQTAMFNPTNHPAKSSTTSLEANPPSQSLGPSVHPPTVSLVKPCVTSYLERSESVNSHESTPVVNVSTEPKSQCPFEFNFGDRLYNCVVGKLDFLSGLLSQDLQAGAEDEQDYDAPKEGNLIYKLYSLHDLLLMVRSSVALSHTRSVGSSENKVQSTQPLQNCTNPVAKA